MARRSRRGFTLVEMLVVVTILGILSGMGIAILAPQISYYRARTSAESVTSYIRCAQYFARTTNYDRADDTFGPIAVRANYPWCPDANPCQNAVPIYGVSFFRGSAAPPFTPYRILFWRDEDPEFKKCDQPGPAATFASLTQEQQSECYQLPLETVLCRVADAAGSDPLANTRLTFRSDGRLDLANSDEENLAPFDLFNNQEFRTWHFDVWNPAVGYIRIRINSDGTIEQSAHGPTGAAPMTKGGSAFE